MNIPKCISFELGYNVFNTYYEGIGEYIERIEEDFHVEWASEKSRGYAIETKQLYELHYYPDTPIGFVLILGSSMNEVFDKAQEIQQQELEEKFK